MSRSRTRKALMLVTALVWAAAIAASFQRFKLSAKPPLTASLLTDPRSVRISVDGQKQFDGAYTETPQTLSLPPGRHRLKIERDGFISQVIKVEGESGDHYKFEDVVLRRAPNVAVTELRLEGPQGAAPIYFQLDDGFLKGETPYESDVEVVIGVEHVLSVFPKWPKKEPRARCKFTITDAQGETNFVIKLRVGKTGGVRFTGCERILTKKKEKTAPGGR